MNLSQGITGFGIIEILIGSFTLSGVATSIVLGTSQKPLGVLTFVVCAATVSLALGVGIVRRSRVGYYLLLFFATLVLASKLLIFAKVIVLSGALETVIPPPIKNAISLIYHLLLILYFALPSSRRAFNRKE
ncbi:MAG: hypothetical protein C4540_02335 [Candidatus Omnitrophota bacterium]|jgi:hypothetical protein|nr:MAG: hypothetical protein C4540_02335 [Candidatus Omnitrophota bacterium]